MAPSPDPERPRPCTSVADPPSPAFVSTGSRRTCAPPRSAWTTSPRCWPTVTPPWAPARRAAPAGGAAPRDPLPVVPPGRDRRLPGGGPAGGRACAGEMAVHSPVGLRRRPRGPRACGISWDPPTLSGGDANGRHSDWRAPAQRAPGPPSRHAKGLRVNGLRSRGSPPVGGGGSLWVRPAIARASDGDPTLIQVISCGNHPRKAEPGRGACLGPGGPLARGRAAAPAAGDRADRGAQRRPGASATTDVGRRRRPAGDHRPYPSDGAPPQKAYRAS